MKFEHKQVELVVITGAKALDPIRVQLENMEPGKGRITIECYGQAWSAYWGGMGKGRTIDQFFCSCDNGYLAGNLSGLNSSVTDFDGLADFARKQVCNERRKNDIDKDEARELFDVFGSLDGCEDLNRVSGPMSEIFGPEWWYSIPTKPNPDHVYLCRIIDAVREALKESEES